MRYKTIICIILIFSAVFSLSLPSFASDTVSAVITDVDGQPDLGITAKSAVLLDADTGTVLYALNADEELPPASVTKIMSLLLIMEAIEKGLITETDNVTASEHAASMGGTQIYLEVGEQMVLSDLIKAIAIPSANDATVAVAEYVAGSEPEFVRLMNERAQALGLQHTNFTSCTGLFDDSSHYTSAYDIAVMTAELMKHKKIFDYTTVWMDSLRDGTFGLANTNKLLRTYSGMNGMKTGFTRLSGHCFSGTATRGDMSLVAVVLGSPSSKERFKDTSAMLDYGFANYSIVKMTPEVPNVITAQKAVKKEYPITVDGDASFLVRKGQEKKITMQIDVPSEITAPMNAGDKIGEVVFSLDSTPLKSFDVTVTEDVRKAGFFDYFAWIIQQIML